MSESEDKAIRECWQKLRERLDQLHQERVGAWHAAGGAFSDLPPIALSSILDLLNSPVLTPKDVYGAMEVFEIVSILVLEGFAMQPDEQSQLACALVRFTRSMPGDLAGTHVGNLWSLLMELPPPTQVQLVQEMCESGGDWHLQHLALWLSQLPREEHNLNQAQRQFLHVLRTTPSLRAALNRRGGPHTY